MPMPKATDDPNDQNEPGGPGQGDPANPPSNDPPNDPPSDPSDPPDPMAALREEVESLKAELRKRPAAATPPPAPKEDPSDEYADFEREFFENPAEAIRRRDERLTKKIQQQLTSEYQRAQSQREFWSKFYDQNQDLKEDDDLVQATLQKNLSKLQDMPVEDATKRLADLTRERIARYSGGKVPSGKGRGVEGNDPPRPPAPPKKEDTRKTLSDLVRERKQQRRAKAQTA